MRQDFPRLEAPSNGAITPHEQWAPPAPDHWADEKSESSGALSPRRVWAALLRHKWLLALSAVLGGGAAYFAYQSVPLEYTASGTVWISIENEGSSLGQPITQGEIFTSSSWLDLLKSYQVLDTVVLQERLFLAPEPADSLIFRDFAVADRFYAGEYRLTVSDDGQRWWLETRQDGEIVDRGEGGGAVGASLGFLWNPPVSELTPEREVDFQVLGPRDASDQLYEQLRTSFTDRGQNFIRLSLSGPDPEKINDVLTAVMEQYANLAVDLKSRANVMRTDILREQVDTTRVQLERVQAQLQSFQIATITLPSEVSGPVAAGLEMTQPNVTSEYFRRRLEREELIRDRDRINSILNETASDTSGLDVVALELIPSVSSSSELGGALNQLVEARAALRELGERYTSEYQLVRDAQDRIRTLERQTIPTLSRTLVGRLDQRAEQEQVVLDSRADELRAIPQRAIQELRLTMEQERLASLFTELQYRYETGLLAARSTIPDVDVLDWPVVPNVPSSDDRVRWATMAFLAMIGAGVAGVLLMEMFDPRIRYPLQVQDDLGMEILGAIPRIRLHGKANTGEVTEAFREIRMRLEFSYGSAKPLIVAITSPDTGEGKTLVSANLAIAFSQLRKRTLLIDADTRRGDIHELLEMDRKPGLTDTLRGTAGENVVRPTSHPLLHFVGSGSRISSSPELLSSSRMQDLMAHAKQNFDVILIDCPPMAAGSDAFVLGAHAGAVLFVMRSGSTHRELAKAKLEAFYRLPVRMLGAVLNDVDDSHSYGNYRYYSYYLPGYRAGEERDEEPSAEPATL